MNASRPLILATLMFTAAAGAIALKPTELVAAKNPDFKLDTLIPAQFGAWEEVKQLDVLVADPTQQENINRIYSQTLSRTYQDTKSGYRIMLSLAYGSNQSDSMQVHKPEVCYPAQGFVVQAKEHAALKTPFGDIATTRVLATMQQRVEPITYWTTVGDRVISNGVHKKIIELSYGLTGKIPDGMLVRISSIDPQSEHAYQEQTRFINDLLNAVTASSRLRLIGSINKEK